VPLSLSAVAWRCASVARMGDLPLHTQEKNDERKPLSWSLATRKG
jgi:hypothetical protein